MMIRHECKPAKLNQLDMGFGQLKKMKLKTQLHHIVRNKRQFAMLLHAMETMGQTKTVCSF